MAYITCKQCGCQMSDKSEACPLCGTPVGEDVTQKGNAVVESNTQETTSSIQTAKHRNWILWIGVAFLAVVAIVSTIIIVQHKNQEKQVAEQVESTEDEKIKTQDEITTEKPRLSYTQNEDKKEGLANAVYEDETTLDLNNVTYDDYCNSRFDFCVSYPVFFKRKFEAYNQDGCEFLYGNNYSLRVYGMHNVMEKTLEELFEDTKSRTDTYTASKDNWFVVSGINEQGNIYYKKTILKNDVEYSVELVYPKAIKSEYNDVLKKVINSFRVYSDEDDEIYQIVDEMPSFPGGEAKLIEFLSNNIHYPKTALENGIQGRVLVGFVVEPDGSVSNVKLLQSIGGGCDEEAIRVIKSLPKWKSGKNHGKPVRVSYQLPISFKLQ